MKKLTSKQVQTLRAIDDGYCSVKALAMFFTRSDAAIRQRVKVLLNLNYIQEIGWDSRTSARKYVCTDPTPLEEDDR